MPKPDKNLQTRILKTEVIEVQDMSTGRVRTFHKLDLKVDDAIASSFLSSAPHLQDLKLPNRVNLTQLITHIISETTNPKLKKDLLANKEILKFLTLEKILTLIKNEPFDASFEKTFTDHLKILIEQNWDSLNTILNWWDNPFFIKFLANNYPEIITSDLAANSSNINAMAHAYTRLKNVNESLYSLYQHNNALIKDIGEIVNQNKIATVFRLKPKEQFEIRNAYKNYFEKRAEKEAEEKAQDPRQNLDTKVSELKGENAYVILGIDKGSDIEEVKQAYKNMALKYHPDRSKNDPNAVEIFKKAGNAYEILRDEVLKDLYDKKYNSMSSKNEETEEHNFNPSPGRGFRS